MSIVALSTIANIWKQIPNYGLMKSYATQRKNHAYFYGMDGTRGYHIEVRKKGIEAKNVSVICGIHIKLAAMTKDNTTGKLIHRTAFWW